MYVCENLLRLQMVKNAESRSRDSREKGASHAREHFVPAALTDSGCEREFNEDRYAVIEGPSGVAWLVCDGMGGVMGGELAAQLAIDSIRRDFESSPVRRPEEAFLSAIREANRAITLRRQNELFANMGTTIAGALIQGSEVVIGHIGDSRVYLLRKGEIQQLTTDHTYVQQLVESGEISPEDALRHPKAHILTRCIGEESVLEMPISRYWIWDTSEDVGDLLMLVTDGLYTLVSDDELRSIGTSYAPPTACVKLVDLAKSRGGFDNITIAIIPIGGELKTSPPSGISLAEVELVDEKPKINIKSSASKAQSIHFQSKKRSVRVKNKYHYQKSMIAIILLIIAVLVILFWSIGYK
jgi:serine/threonine protein phosphatase PrpC